MKRSIISLFAVALSFVTLSAHGALIEYLPFSGNTNAVVGTSGVGVNGPTFGPDQFGNPNNAIQFTTSASSYVNVAGGGGLNNLQSGTIYFTAKWTGTQGGGVNSFGDLVARQSDGVFSNDVIGLDGSNPATAHVSLQLYNANPAILTGSTVVGDGVWHNVAVTFTSNGVTGTETLYVDGHVDGTASVAGIIKNDVTVPLAIGAWTHGGSGYSNSSLNDFRVYDTVLTQAQIQAIPEPSSVVLFGLGAAGLLLAARRRRKA